MANRPNDIIFSDATFLHLLTSMLADLNGWLIHEFNSKCTLIHPPSTHQYGIRAGRTELRHQFLVGLQELLLLNRAAIILVKGPRSSNRTMFQRHLSIGGTAIGNVLLIEER